MWLVSLLGGVQAGTFFAGINFIGKGVILGGMSGQLFQKDFIKSNARSCSRHGFEVGSFVFLYSGFSNSLRIIRKKDDSSNHFIGGVLGGTIASLTIGFSEYDSPANGVAIQLKADPSGVFKQYKPRKPFSRHLLTGLMLGTVTFLWNSYSRSIAENRKNNQILHQTKEI